MSETRNAILEGLRVTRDRLRALPPVRPVWWDADPVECERRRVAWAVERHRRARAYWRGSYGSLELTREVEAPRPGEASLEGKAGRAGASLPVLDEAGQVAGELGREVEAARRLLRLVPGAVEALRRAIREG